MGYIALVSLDRNLVVMEYQIFAVYGFPVYCFPVNELAVYVTALK